MERNESIAAVRSIVGDDCAEMDIVHSLHLARNNVQMAINILLDSPGFKRNSAVRQPKPAVAAKNSTQVPAQKSAQVPPQRKPSPAPAAKNTAPATPPVAEVPAKVTGVTTKRSRQELEADRESSSNPNSELYHRSSPEQVGAVTSKSEMRAVVDLTSNDVQAAEGSGFKYAPVDESKWWLLKETEVEAFSTTKTSKLNIGDMVTFTFPKREDKAASLLKRWGRPQKQSSEIIRFSTHVAGEIGRLPSDWAKCLLPLVHSDRVKITGSCKSSPSVLNLMSTVVLSIRVYINEAFFQKYKGTASIEETTFRPFPSLMDLLGSKAVKTAEFSPEDLNVFTKKRSQDTAPIKRMKASEASEGEDEELCDADINHVVGTTDSSALQEMEEPEGLECKLRGYQRQALYWMSKLEIGVTREDAAKSLHPCWSAYSLVDRRASHFYVNSFSGEATLDFPSALQTAKGGILADAMGLGKTVMTISLLLANRGRGGLSEDPVQTSAGQIKKHKGGGTLIICPMTLLGQWQSELQVHVASGIFNVHVYYGNDRTRDSRSLSRHDVVLTTYGIVQSEFSTNGKDGPLQSVHWFRIVLDEAHTIKSSKSASAKAVYELAGDRRLCLTGTPVQNKLEDLFSLFHFLRVEPWCNWGWWYKLIQKPYEESDERGLNLLQAILKPLMLRRTKDSTDKDGRPILVLPSVTYEIVECDLSEAEKDFYDALYHKSKVQFDQFVEQGKVLHNFCSILELLLRLRQCCDHPFLVLSRGDTDKYADLEKLGRQFLKNGSALEPTKAYVQGVVDDLKNGEISECPICLELPEDAVLTPCAHSMCRECLFNSWRSNGGGSCPVCRRTIRKQELITVPTKNRFRINVDEQWVESSKVKALLQQLRQLREAGSKCVVFSQWTSFLDLIEIPLKRQNFCYVRLDGQLSQAQRERVLKEFSTMPSVTIMLISLKAGGVGLNLTAASCAFILDPWWNPAVEEQAIMRVHRIGQKNAVTVKRFIVKGTVEEKMQQVQARKQRMIAGALTDEEVRTVRIEELKMLFR